MRKTNNCRLNDGERERKSKKKRKKIYLKIKHISHSKANLTCGPFVFLKCLKIAKMLSGARSRARIKRTRLMQNDQLVEYIDGMFVRVWIRTTDRYFSLDTYIVSIRLSHFSAVQHSVSRDGIKISYLFFYDMFFFSSNQNDKRSKSPNGSNSQNHSRFTLDLFFFYLLFSFLSRVARLFNLR